MSDTTPNFADWVATFVRGVMGITTVVCPDGSPALTWAYQIAVDIAWLGMKCISNDIYTLAVYNLAGSNLLNFAPDQTGQTFFADTRKALGLNVFKPGIIQAGSDEGSSGTLLVPDFFKNLSLADLQYLKDPYGQQYLIFMQRYGDVWGLTQ